MFGDRHRQHRADHRHSGERGNRLLIDTVRYYLALVLLVSLPSALVFWYLAHGFAERWRRMPAAVTYSSLLGAMVATGAAIWSIRGPLLAVELGWSYWLLLPAGVIYAASIAVESLCHRQLALRTLIGVPELVGGADGQGLLREGIFDRVRHPRYLALVLGVFAMAFFVNYLAVWALVPAFAAGLYLVTLMEERELVRRFGDAYREYQEQVPRLLPRR